MVRGRPPKRKVEVFYKCELCGQTRNSHGYNNAMSTEEKKVCNLCVADLRRVEYRNRMRYKFSDEQRQFVFRECLGTCERKFHAFDGERICPWCKMHNDEVNMSEWL
jgi:hypothetical protein